MFKGDVRNCNKICIKR